MKTPSTPTLAAVDQPRLVRRFADMKGILPKGKLARWADARWLFGHREEINRPAEETRVAMMFHGARSRERWKSEYRHQRKLARIRLAEHP